VVEIVLVPDSDVVVVVEGVVVVVVPSGVVVEATVPEFVVAEVPGAVVALDEPGDPTTVVVDLTVEGMVEARGSSVVGALASMMGAIGTSFTWSEAVPTTPHAVAVTKIVTANQASTYLETCI
jgi:hypothetical protein